MVRACLSLSAGSTGLGSSSRWLGPEHRGVSTDLPEHEQALASTIDVRSLALGPVSRRAGPLDRHHDGPRMLQLATSPALSGAQSLAPKGSSARTACDGAARNLEVPWCARIAFRRPTDRARALSPPGARPHPQPPESCSLPVPLAPPHVVLLADAMPACCEPFAARASEWSRRLAAFARDGHVYGSRPPGGPAPRVGLAAGYLPP